MDITVQELKERLDKGDKIVVIDVRESEEYAEFNIGAEHIPLGIFPYSLDDYEDDKDQEIVIHCRSGKRSEAAKQLMMQNGFTNVRNLLGGMLAWQAAFGS